MRQCQELLDGDIRVALSPQGSPDFLVLRSLFHLPYPNGIVVFSLPAVRLQVMSRFSLAGL